MGLSTVIFGCGYHGRAAYRKCKIKNIEVINWVDNNKKLIGNKYFDLKVLSPIELRNIDFDQIILCGRNIKDQIKQLKYLKIKKKKLIWNFFDLKPLKRNIIKRDKKLYQILKLSIKKLEKNKIKYWADTSGLLSLVRKDNISLLSDFDLAIEYKNLKKIFKLFSSSKLLKVTKHNIIRGKKKYPQISIKSYNNTKIFEPAIIDFSFYKKIKNTYYKFDNIRKKFPSKYLGDLIFYNYKDLKIKAPLKSDEYLKNIYGKSFRKKVKFYQNPLKFKSLKHDLKFN